MAYLARRKLRDAGIGLGDLVDRLGRSKTTWSKFLNGHREPQSGDPRAEIEALLEESGVPTGPHLWLPEGTSQDEAPEEASDENSNRNKEIIMQGQSLSAAAQKQWKLFMNPFDPEAMLDAASGRDRIDDLFMPVSHAFIEQRLIQAFTKAGFVALAGEAGSGKSTLLERAFRQASEIKPVIKVSPANVERRKMTAVHLSGELIRQLSEERVPRQANVRDALAETILTQRYEQGQRVALVVDEAHELPHNTIKDLKRFHEMTHGFARLLAIILVGQSELRARFDLERNYRLREAIIRCQLMVLKPMAGEVNGYLRKRFSWIGRDLDEVFEAGAVEAIERRLAVHEQQYPVLMGNVATAAMNVAARRGNPKVSDEDVEAVWAATPEHLQELGL